MYHTEQALINVIICWGAYIVLTILAIIWATSQDLLPAVFQLYHI
jgi:hypothetical protein